VIYSDDDVVLVRGRFLITHPRSSVSVKSLNMIQQ
jgi:hypothetical protein